MVIISEYTTLAGATVRVMFDGDAVRTAAKASHPSPEARCLDILLAIIEWDVSDAKPTRQTMRQLPIDVPYGLADSMVQAVARSRRARIWP